MERIVGGIQSIIVHLVFTTTAIAFTGIDGVFFSLDGADIDVASLRALDDFGL